MKIDYQISNWIYGKEPLEKAFIRLKKFGYDGIELMVEDHNTFDLGVARALIERYELPCFSIATMMKGAVSKEDRQNLIDKDEGVQKRTIEYINGALDFGNELGARLALTVPSGVANVTDSWNPANVELMVQNLAIIGDHAKSLGSIVLAIEPINRYENSFLRRCDQALELIDALKHPNVKVMLDFFHTNIEEDNNGEAIRLAGDNLVHCHIADSNRKSTGRGNTDWFEIMRALKGIDFNGSVACEPLPPTSANVYESIDIERPEADLYARECIEYLKYIESVV
ncbi:MAG: sugar phosphate isomerase/epimerase family protein [Promethearchaeota archaeon]